jgi:hypothetical protein
LAEAERFVQLAPGHWVVRFQKGKRELLTDGFPEPTSAPEPSLAMELIARGVKESVAKYLWSSHPAAHVKTRLVVFDSLIARKSRKVSENPQGYLVSSIKARYRVPRRFFSKKTPSRTEVAAARLNQSSPKRTTNGTLRGAAEIKKTRLAIEAFWQSMPEPERRRLEAEVIADAPKIARDAIERGGPFANPSPMPSYVSLSCVI